MLIVFLRSVGCGSHLEWFMFIKCFISTSLYKVCPVVHNIFWHRGIVLLCILVAGGLKCEVEFVDRTTLRVQTFLFKVPVTCRSFKYKMSKRTTLTVSKFTLQHSRLSKFEDSYNAADKSVLICPRFGGQGRWILPCPPYPIMHCEPTRDFFSARYDGRSKRKEYSFNKNLMV